MKKSISFLLAAALCLGLCSCIPKGDAESIQSSGNLPIALEKPVDEAQRLEMGGFKFCASFPSMANPFYSVVNHAIKTAVQANGDSLVTLDPGGDQATQITQIEDMISEGIDVMILAPVDPAGIRPALEALQAADVPVINTAVRVQDEALADCMVVSDADAAGTLCAGDVLERRARGGRVMVLEEQANPLKTAAVSAWDSLITGDEWTAVGHWETGGLPERAAQAVNDCWNTTPYPVDVIFAGSDAAAIGAVNALQSHGVREGTVLIYGVGGSPEAKRLISAGWITATASQCPSAIGAKTAEVAYQLMKGAAPEKETIVPVTLVTPENIAEQSLDTWN